MQSKIVNGITFVRALIAFIGLTLLGVVFLVLASIAGKQKVPENYVEVEATIVKIEQVQTAFYDPSDPTNPSNYEYYVYADYTYGGKTFSNVEVGNYSSTMKAGDKVPLFVNPDNPAQYMSDPSGVGIFKVLSIGIILLGVGGFAVTLFKRMKGQ